MVGDTDDEGVLDAVGVTAGVVVLGVGVGVGVGVEVLPASTTMERIPSRGSESPVSHRSPVYTAVTEPMGAGMPLASDSTVNEMAI